VKGITIFAFKLVICFLRVRRRRRRRRRRRKEGGGEGNEDAAEAKGQDGAGLFCEDQDGEQWVRCQGCLKWAHTVWANHRKRAFVCV